MATFTNDDTLPKILKTLSTSQCTVRSTMHCPQHIALSAAQCTVHITVHCPQHSTLSTARCTVHSTVQCPQHSAVHKQEQQPNPRTTPAVLKVQHQSNRNMTSRHTVSVTHGNVQNSLNVSSNRYILFCYTVPISTTSSFPLLDDKYNITFFLKVLTVLFLPNRRNCWVSNQWAGLFDKLTAIISRRTSHFCCQFPCEEYSSVFPLHPNI